MHYKLKLANERITNLSDERTYITQQLRESEKKGATLQEELNSQFQLRQHTEIKLQKKKQQQIS